MGFLSGAYGKIMAGKLVRQLQWQLTSVTQRATRVTKQIGDMEKFFNSQERMYNTQMSTAFNGYRTQMLNEAYRQQAEGKDPAQVSQGYSYGVYGLQQYMMFDQQMLAEQFDIMRDMQLEPLKALQEELETEKDNLESRLQLARGDYEAKKKEEQDGAKNMVPDYTGQGS